MTKARKVSHELISLMQPSMGGGLETMLLKYISYPPLLALTPGVTIMSFGEGCEASFYGNITIIATEI